MKRTVVKIKSKCSTDEIWCEVNGTSIELMGAYIGLTENLVQSFKKEGKSGELALKRLLSDTIEVFERENISLKELKSND